VERLLVTPSPFNTLLWRVVAITPEGFSEGFHSLLDAPGPIRFERFERGQDLYARLQDHPPVATLAAFSDGFYKLAQRGDGAVLITDLRMGQEPHYTFSFVVAQQAPGGALQPLSPPVGAGSRGDLRAGLAWLGRRLRGEDLPTPR
jgi:inner membrane protein